MNRDLLLLWACLFVGGMELYAQAPNRMNVLFIVADDMNGYGVWKEYPLAQTPYLDKLASQSLNFTHAACNAPVCVPSRASFFSGIAPHVSGAYLNGSDPWRTSEVLQRAESLPECFKRNGYITSGHGKIFHAKLGGTRHQEMWDNPVFMGGFGPFPASPDEWLGGAKFRSVKAWEGPDSDFPDNVNAEQAISFLQEDHEAPFFLFYGLWRPHTPYTAPKRFFEPFEDVDMPFPPGMVPGDLEDVPGLGQELVDSLFVIFRTDGQPDSAKLKRFLQGYCATTLFADWNIGRVLEALDSSRYADNTVVIFCSDNGYHVGEKMHWQKATLWDQADLVPFMIRLPGGKVASCDQPITLLDVYPTLVELCQLEPPHQSLDGQSLVPILQQPETEGTTPALTTLNVGYASVRDERYRYIIYPDGSEEAYDYRKDPHELDNLIGTRKGAKIRKRLADYLPETYAPSIGGKWEVAKARGK
ncbi:sulfatase [Pontibacter sp. G13]|uniref:sulfatase n=1 Tax=Pontibacter sp. G13 TaxID=3074898 RepID=UPI00288B6B54|nr:sulfatase [Pontibacter sp. G13]WNJ19131.1 sulfatase [Pontibacter sp. G13]